jgi:hypothetical protein
MKIRSAWFVAIAWTVVGCANFSQLQEADTLPRGEFRMGAGASVTAYETEIGSESDTFIVPAANVWARYGITDEFEMHANLWIPLGASVGGKYQLVGGPTQEGFALSLGLDVGALSLSSGDSKVTVVDFYVPVYTGYRFSEAFQLYLTPKYVLRTLFGDATDLQHMAGGTLGVTIGKGFRFHIEGSGLYDITLGAPVVNGAFGFTF